MDFFRRMVAEPFANRTCSNAQYLFTNGLLAAHHTEITTALAALLVGIVVGITGMGGGALMTPALIFLGVGHVSSIVTADLTAAAIYKSGGAAVHWRDGSPNLRRGVPHS